MFLEALELLTQAAAVEAEAVEAATDRLLAVMVVQGLLSLVILIFIQTRLALLAEL
jgi:hypothetical protein